MSIDNRIVNGSFETGGLSPFVGFNATVTLAAGDTITLELFGLIGAATPQGGEGAGLTIIRLDD